MIRRLPCLFLAALFSVPSANAQPGVWMEVGDAPEGVPDRQLTVGIGELTQIVGSLDRPNGDHVDTYCIVIDDPAIFYASTSSHLGGSLSLPRELLISSRMWLWSASTASEGAGLLLANDDDATDPLDLGSTITDPNTFTMFTMGMIDPTAAGINLTAGATYLLSISTFDNDPLDASGLNLSEIDLTRLTDLYGPNPVAGPFDQWENGPSTDVGGYLIALQARGFARFPNRELPPWQRLACSWPVFCAARHSVARDCDWRKVIDHLPWVPVDADCAVSQSLDRRSGLPAAMWPLARAAPNGRSRRQSAHTLAQRTIVA